MIPHILGSKPVVEAMEADLKPRVELLRQQGIVPKLAIVRVGANPDDLSYERMAIKRAESLDIAVQVFDYPENVDPELVAGDIRYINEDASIHGCLMFRPLPEYMDEQALCNMLVPHKDVDGISLAASSSTTPMPCRLQRRRPASRCSIITLFRFRASALWWWDVHS